MREKNEKMHYAGLTCLMMNPERVKNAEEHRCRRGAFFAFGRKGVLMGQNGAAEPRN
jgi:hypothetical protein